MKSPLLVLFIALTVSAMAANAEPSAAPSAAPTSKPTKWRQHQLDNYRNSAPADETFGRGKLTYLGMNNTFRDAAISSGAHTTDPAIAATVARAEEALEAWAQKYPRDPQLARTYFLALQVDRKSWLKAHQDRAWTYLNRLVQEFPNSYFGKQLKRDLANGFTEHYYAPAMPCAPATPAPDDAPSDMPVQIDVPAPTPSPAASPSPGPTETTLAKGLRVQVLPQACVPPTPSPAPSSSPTPSESPSESPSPSPSPSAPPTAGTEPSLEPSSTPPAQRRTRRLFNRT